MKENEIIPGTLVTYYNVIKSNGEKLNPLQTFITSEPWKIGREVVCKINGKSGGVSIKHLESR